MLNNQSMEILKNRQSYMDILLDYKDKRIIKVLTGIRRCGKSAMLSLFADKLIEIGISKEQIIQINFESIKFNEISDYKILYETIKNQIKPNQKTYLFFDEIQMVKDWEKAVNSFLVDFDIDIYITGSNAYLLSSELSTLLSGRYVEIKMLPLSFKEFLDFYSFDANLTIEDKFTFYLKYGGMPQILEYAFNDKTIYGVLEGIYNTVIVKDVLQRNKILEHALLKRLVEFLAQNIGSINSVNSISNFLVSQKIIESSGKYPNRTIENYILALQDAFIFYDIKRYDIRGKSLLKTLGKNYIVDIGLRNMLLGYRDTDRGHILENIIYIELIRRGYKVYIGKYKDMEIDFIAENPKEKIYYQITESLIDKNTLEREISPLKQIDNNYEKVILSLDRNFITSQDGIKIKYIIDFLLLN